MIEPNPLRNKVRAQLVEFRRQGWIARRAFKITGQKKYRDKYKHCRKMDRILSVVLAGTPPMINELADPIWSARHFARFRHPSRFSTYSRVWDGDRNRWQKRD